jgi:hypothetical protein
MDLADVPPQPPVGSAAALLPPLDPDVSQNFIGSGMGESVMHPRFA